MAVVELVESYTGEEGGGREREREREIMLIERERGCTNINRVGYLLLQC